MAFIPKVEDWRWDVAKELEGMGDRNPALCTSLMLALMQAESEGNPDAAGAQDEVGLFQIVPYGTDPIWRLNRPPASKLADPDYNIAWAASHLNNLLRTQDEPYTAILAYNTGPGGVAGAAPRKHTYARNIIAWTKGDIRAAFHGRYSPDISPIDPETWDRNRTAEDWGTPIGQGFHGCLEVEEHLLITAARPTQKKNGIFWLLVAAGAAYALTRKG